MSSHTQKRADDIRNLESMRHAMLVNEHVGKIASAVQLLQSSTAELKAYLGANVSPVPPYHTLVLDEIVEQVRSIVDTLSDAKAASGAAQPTHDSSTSNAATDAVHARIEAEEAMVDAVRALRNHAPAMPATAFEESLRVALGGRREPEETLVARSSHEDDESPPQPVSVNGFEDDLCVRLFEPEVVKTPYTVLIAGGKRSGKSIAAYNMMARSRHSFEYMYVLTCADLTAERDRLDLLFEAGEVLLTSFACTSLASIIEGAEETLTNSGVAEKTAVVVDLHVGALTPSEWSVVGSLFKRANAAGVTLFVVVNDLSGMLRWYTDFSIFAMTSNAHRDVLNAAFKSFFSTKLRSCDDFSKVYYKVVKDKSASLVMRRDENDIEHLEWFSSKSRIVAPTPVMAQPSAT